MIQVCVLRVAICEICKAQKVLGQSEAIPMECWQCASPHWEFGPPCQEKTRRRAGSALKEKVLDPGKHVDIEKLDWARKQWRQFKDEEGNPIPRMDRGDS